jgi:hypothetical protein
MAREFVGLTGKYGNFQHGEKSKVKADQARGEQVFKHGGNIDGERKTKFIFYLTPLVAEPGEEAERLAPGDEENESISVDYYAVVWDGELYKGDDIQKLDCVLINNMDSSNGMNPRVVIEGTDGQAHTFAAEASVNGHVFRGPTLNVN